MSKPNVVLDPHPRKVDRVFSPEGFHAIGRMVVDDLEAMHKELPPTLMQIAPPEMVKRLGQERDLGQEGLS